MLIVSFKMFSCICWIAHYIESLYKGRMLHRGQTHAWPITVVKYPVEVGISFARWKLKETANSICPFNCLWAVSTAGQWLWRLDARNHAAANVLQALVKLLSAQTKCKISKWYTANINMDLCAHLFVRFIFYDPLNLKIMVGFSFKYNEILSFNCKKCTFA